VAQINPDSVKTSESSCPIEYLDTSNITRGSVLEIQKFENLLAAPSRARRRVIDGDIVYSTVRPNQLHFGMIVNPSSQLLVSTGFTVVRCVEKFISKYYIYLALTQQNTIEYYQQLAETTTSTFPAIRADDIGSYSIVIPPGDIIKDYHAVVARLFEDVKNRYQQNSSLQHLRDALLPKLMSGEIEVPVEG
jgi:type I restriction enzyme S subunit